MEGEYERLVQRWEEGKGGMRVGEKEESGRGIMGDVERNARTERRGRETERDHGVCGQD